MRYLYAVYALLTFVVLFLLLVPFFYIFGLMGTSGQKCIWYLVKGWGYLWFFLLGIRVKRVFEVKPEKSGNYIVIANHSSFLDTPMIFRCMPFMALPLATESFARIPLFGFLYKKMAILVDRASIKSRRRSVRRMSRALSNGHSIFIFPEGGIIESGKTLNPFYDGAFKLALESGIPILPVLFPDTQKRWTPGSFWNWRPGKSRVIFLQVIEPDGFSVAELKQHAFAQMEEALIKYRNGN